MMNGTLFVDLLVQTFTCIDNAQRKAYEQELYRQFTPNSFKELVELSVNSQTAPNVQEYALTFLNAYVKKVSGNEVGKFDTDTKLEQLMYLVNALKVSSSSKHKSLINTIISVILSNDMDNFLRTCVQKELIKCLRDSDLNNIEAGLFLFIGVVESLDLYRLGQIEQNLQLEWVQEFAQKGKDLLLKDYMTITRADPTQRQNIIKLQKIHYISNKKRFQLIKQWCYGASILCKKIYTFKGFPKDYLIAFQNFLHRNQEMSIGLFSVGVSMLQTGDQQKDIYISTTGDKEIDKLLNEAKVYAFQCYNQILNVLVNDRQRKEIIKTPIYASLNQMIPIVLTSLVYLARSQKIDMIEFIRDPLIANLVSNFIQFLVHCGGHSDFYKIFNDARVAILLDVIFPLLGTSQSEYMQMIDEPEQFVNLALDTIDKQESEIPKTAAAKFLEMLCDHIDGSPSLIAQICVTIISKEIKVLEGQNSNSQLDSILDQFLQKISDRYFFSKVSSIYRIDSSLMAITIMSYLLSKRADIIILIEIMLKENERFFKNENLDPLIRARLALFLGYYCDNLFKAESAQPHLLEYVKILLNQLKPTNQTWQLAITYQSIDALKNIVEDEDLIPIIKSLIPQIFLYVVECLIDSYYAPHYEMIQSIYRIYAFDIKTNINLFIQSIQLLIKKIDKELQKGEKDNLFITKTMNILRCIPEADYNFEFLKVLDDQLCPLYKLMVQETPFEEDILYLLCSMITKTGCITLTQQALFPLFPRIVQNQKYRLGIIFELLNLYLRHGTELFFTLDNQKILFELVFSVINNVNENDVLDNQIDEGEGVLLLHLAIQTISQRIEKSVFTTILQAAIAKIKTIPGPTCVKSRLFGVFLSAFFVDFERTSQILNEIGLAEQVVGEIINFQSYDSGYEIKLYIASVSKFQLIEYQPSLFNTGLILIMVQYLLNQKDLDEALLEKEDNSSDEDMFDGNFQSTNVNIKNFYQNIQEQKMAYKYFKSDILYIDEYEIFKTLLQNIKQVKPEYIEMLKTQLSPKELQHLQNTISCVRVESTDGQFMSRKIVTGQKKRKAPQQ